MDPQPFDGYAYWFYYKIKYNPDGLVERYKANWLLKTKIKLKDLTTKKPFAPIEKVVTIPSFQILKRFDIGIFINQM